jgi:hypothetical protein
MPHIYAMYGLVLTPRQLTIVPNAFRTT